MPAVWLNREAHGRSLNTVLKGVVNEIGNGAVQLMLISYYYEVMPMLLKLEMDTLATC
jgi:hypothetical protein